MDPAAPTCDFVSTPVSLSGACSSDEVILSPESSATVPGGAPARPDLEAVRDLLPGIVDALTDAVVIVDSERRVAASNRRYAEIFGTRRVDLIGSACTDERHRPEADTGSPARCAVCEVIARSAPARRLIAVHDDRGAVRRYETTFSPIPGAGTPVTHVIEVWRDITERSQLEVQLSHSERLASVGILAAGVAHEINNPLASMLAGTEGLARWIQRAQFDAASVEEAAEIVKLLEGEILRCRDTTQKLVLLGRSYETIPGWIDLNRAVRDTLALLSYEMRRHNIETAADLDPGLPAIWAREAAIRGMCMNLMINAVQAMGSAGGTLTARTRRNGDHVTLAIADTGPGIAPEHLERIWDPFFTTKPVGQGTGLGLSITSRIVARHGGRIGVDSSPGRGTRFDVELPVHGPGGEA
jgi:PAS domain S-box-containing protein